MQDALTYRASSSPIKYTILVLYKIKNLTNILSKRHYQITCFILKYNWVINTDEEHYNIGRYVYEI